MYSDSQNISTRKTSYPNSYNTNPNSVSLQDKQVYLKQEIGLQEQDQREFQEYLTKNYKPKNQRNFEDNYDNNDNDDINCLKDIPMAQLQSLVAGFKAQQSSSIFTFSQQQPSQGFQQQQYQESQINQSAFQRNRQPSSYLNQKKGPSYQSFALHKELDQEEQKQSESVFPEQLQQQSLAQPQQRSASISYSNSSLSNNLPEDVLRSEWGRSVSVVNSSGENIMRREAVVVPSTSTVRDTFVRRNLEGVETSKVIACNRLDPLASKIGVWIKQQQQQQAESGHQGIQPSLEVHITGYKTISDGLLGSDYAVYTIETSNLNWTVDRRFSEFEWLFNNLSSTFAPHIIPPIPSKTAVKHMSPQHLQKRLNGFELFLQHVLLSDTLRLAPQVSDFLSITDSKLLTAKRNMYDKQQVNYSIPFLNDLPVNNNPGAEQNNLGDDQQLNASQRISRSQSEYGLNTSELGQGNPFQSELLTSSRTSTQLNVTAQTTTNKKTKSSPQTSSQSMKLLDEMISLSGSVTSEITPALKEYYQQQQQLNEKSLLNYEALNASIGRLSENLQQASIEAQTISKIFTKMEKAHQLFNTLSPLSKYPLLETMNQQFSELFVGLGDALNDMQTAFTKDLMPFMQFQTKILTSQQQAIANRNNLETIYLTELAELETKKKKLFKEQKISKWKLDSSCEVPVAQLSSSFLEAQKYMLPEKTKEVTKLGEYFGYMNKCVYDDMDEQAAKQKLTFNLVMSKFAQKITLILNELLLHAANSDMNFVQLMAANHMQVFKGNESANNPAEGGSSHYQLLRIA